MRITTLQRKKRNENDKSRRKSVEELEDDEEKIK